LVNKDIQLTVGWTFAGLKDSAIFGLVIL